VLSLATGGKEKPLESFGHLARIALLRPGAVRGRPARWDRYQYHNANVVPCQLENWLARILLCRLPSFMLSGENGLQLPLQAQGWVQIGIEHQLCLTIGEASLEPATISEERHTATLSFLLVIGRGG